MKALILGYQVVDYVKKDSNEHKQGLSVYYAAANDRTAGLMTGETYVNKITSPELYQAIYALDVSAPVFVDMGFDMQIGSRYPKLVSIKVDSDG